ncbi:MAG: thioredoxin family protein [Sinomicrobium sp.]|nr:thioredoxin family protein [Sinomicrobium sp.]
MKKTVYILMLLFFTGISLKAQSNIAPLADKAALETAVKNNEKAVVICAAEWCEYCKAFLPKVEKIISDHENVKFFRINYDENVGLFQAEGIEATPTVKLYKNGLKTNEMVIIETAPLQEKLRDF